MTDASEGREKQHRWWSPHVIIRIGHFELALSLIALLVVQAFISTTSFFERVLFSLLFLGVIIASIRTLSGSHRRIMVALTCAVAAFFLSVVDEFYPSIALHLVILCVYIGMFLLLMFALAEDVFLGGAVDADRIVGAVCFFMVMGLQWAFVFTLLQILDPSSFELTINPDVGGAQQGLLSEFIYFSHVTLTTLGYGDIVPITRPARLLSSLEAMFGQLYLAIIVARLVGLHIAERTHAEATRTNDGLEPPSDQSQ